jgi:hypothetical protein
MLKSKEYPQEVKVSGDISSFAIAAQEELNFSNSTLLKKYKVNLLSIELHSSGDSLWMLADTGNDGCVAFRLCYHPGEIKQVRISGNKIHVKTPSGAFDIKLDFIKEKNILHYTTTVTPAENLKIPYYPRDVYTLNQRSRRAKSEGIIYAQQRGPKGGFLFFSLTKPVSGTYLYMQDFTSLNKYFSYTKTTPEGSVGGEWPEMGFALPPSGENYIPKGRTTIISDAYVCFSPDMPSKDTQSGRLFLDMLAQIYPHLKKPATKYVDWIEYASKAVSSLQSKSALRRLNGHYFLNAYTGSDYKPPESMVQLSIHVPAMEFEHWRGRPVSLKRKIQNNISQFYNEDVKSIVRWLPGAKFDGKGNEEEGHHKMDSWYLYHILMNYGRLAQLGNQEARRLFLSSIDYSVKVARHFNYEWPIFYDIKTLKPLKKKGGPEGLGEIDVGGLYCKVMMLGYRMTKDETYLEEAKAAVKKMGSLGFGLMYQTNTTLLGAAAMGELYNTTGDQQFLDISILCIANVMYNAWLWECNYGYARKYTTFFGLPPLHDGKYIACYEETESLATLIYYLEIIGNMLPESVIMLCSEYMKYLLHRGKYYFPYNLPPEGIAEESREGFINKKLSVPLEDIYDGWEKAGQVGQEVYGSGTAFVAVTCAYKNFKELPFIVYCSYPVLKFSYNIDKADKTGEVLFQPTGSSLFKCEVRIIKREKEKQINISCYSGGRKISARVQDGDIRFLSGGNNKIKITWSYKNNKRRKKNGDI